MRKSSICQIVCPVKSGNQRGDGLLFCCYGEEDGCPAGEDEFNGDEGTDEPFRGLRPLVDDHDAKEEGDDGIEETPAVTGGAAHFVGGYQSEDAAGNKEPPDDEGDGDERKAKVLEDVGTHERIQNGRNDVPDAKAFDDEGLVNVEEGASNEEDTQDEHGGGGCGYRDGEGD